MAGSLSGRQVLPDWTVAAHNSRRNTSALFIDTSEQVESVLRNHIADFHAGRISDIAEAVVAFLANHATGVRLVPVE